MESPFAKAAKTAFAVILVLGAVAAAGYAAVSHYAQPTARDASAPAAAAAPPQRRRRKLAAAPASPPSAPGSPPSAPASQPAAPASPPSAPGSPPSAPASPPSAPASLPSAPGSPPSAPGSPPSAPAGPHSAPASPPSLLEPLGVYTLPPIAPDAPLQTVVLSPLELQVFTACAILEDAQRDACTFPGGLCAFVARLQQAAPPLRSARLLALGAQRQEPSGVLLCGPCDAGKALVMRCLQQSASRPRFLSLTAFMQEHMYEGDTARLISAAFSLARKIAPCIVFIDDADSLLPHDERAAGLCKKKLCGDFFSAWESARSSTGLLVLAASARPTAINRAALRLLDMQLEVPLPDAPAREDILRALLRGELCSESLAAALGGLAAQTEGFSSSDLKELVKDAARVPMLEAVPAGMLRIVRGVSAADFELVLPRARFSVQWPQGQAVGVAEAAGGAAALAFA